MRSKLLGSIAALAIFASACGNSGPDMTARGTASAAWSITVFGRSATCAEVGAASVSLRLHSRASGADVASAFPCTDAHGSTSPVAAGAYDATLTLRAADGAPMTEAPTQAAVTIAAGQIAALAPVTFASADRGKLVLSLATLATRANCAPRDQGGATGAALTLEHAGRGCATVTLVRSRGNASLGMYTVNCSSPVVTSCIERDETLAIDGIESGPYALKVTALMGTIPCWSGADVLSVPAGAALAKPVQLALDQAPGC